MLHGVRAALTQSNGLKCVFVDRLMCPMPYPRHFQRIDVASVVEVFFGPSVVHLSHPAGHLLHRTQSIRSFLAQLASAPKAFAPQDCPFLADPNRQGLDGMY